MSKEKIPQLAPPDFALICFLILMQNGEGILDKHPDYIREKVGMIGMGYEAIGKLDVNNIRKLMEWHEKWNVQLPPEIKKLHAQVEEVVKELAERGFNLQ